LSAPPVLTSHHFFFSLSRRIALVIGSSIHRLLAGWVQMANDPIILWPDGQMTGWPRRSERLILHPKISEFIIQHFLDYLIYFQ
jgi:hypothetical protein